jgi:peptidoglycan hydrolase-like protein with peptidoglycan-binding domain
VDIRARGKFGRQIVAVARRYETPLTDAAVALIVVLGLAAATSGYLSATGRQVAASVDRAGTDAQRQPSRGAPAPLPAKPLNLVSVSPGNGATGVNGTDPIKVTFTSDLSSSTPLPKVYPDVAGSWQVSGKTATFTPRVGFSPRTPVRVTIPAGMKGVPANKETPAPVFKQTRTARFATSSYSTGRLQQLLAQLGYLPITFHPSGGSADDIAASDAKAQLSAAYDPPSGWYSWNGSWPSELTSQWKTGENNMLDAGAIRAFEYSQGLTMDGDAGPEVWSHLLTAVAKGEKNPHGYAYALTTQGGSNENLQVWRDGKRILYTAANTGIAGAPTADGTYPVFDRLSFQVMQGTNPDGSTYADPVHWIAYFDGGDAIHGFDRASYGYYQSVGCVEIPISTAQWLWPYLTYGTLVTVQGPEA